MANRKTETRNITREQAKIVVTAQPQKPKGKAAGCRKGEERLTVILGVDEIRLLKAFAWNAGITFRALVGSMAQRYIKTVIQKYIEDNGKLRPKPGEEPPEKYKDLFTNEGTISKFDEYLN